MASRTSYTVNVPFDDDDDYLRFRKAVDISDLSMRKWVKSAIDEKRERDDMERSKWK
jgi:hypothetical protein